MAFQELEFLSKIESLREGYVRDPLLRRYLAHIQSGELVHNTEPWHAQGERQLALVTLLSILLGDVPSPAKNMPFANEASVIVNLGIRLARAEVVLWSNETEEIAFGLDLPEHIVSKDALPFDSFFMSHETCLLTEDGGTTNWTWIMREEGYPGIVVMYDIVHDDSVELTGFTFDTGLSYPKDYKNPGVGLILKYCAFLNSPYIKSEKHYLPRHIRRERERARTPIHNDYTILLRRAESHSTGPHTTSSGRTLHHQFWVKSHYRAQWYAKEKAHKVIIIPTFLKGPANAPFITRTYKVGR